MKVALHICCAVCAAGAIEKLELEQHQVYGFFFNPNIHPEEEYLKRLQSVQKVAAEYGIPLIVAEYQTDAWFNLTRSLENEPEGGERCPICFRMRLARTFQFMLESGCDGFTTTLTMGSNKNAFLLGKIGKEIGGEHYLEYDFKKKEGFKRTLELARRWGLYRQNYCGCIYSLREAEKRRKK